MPDLTKLPGYASTAYLEDISIILQKVKQRSHELMRVSEGQRVLDVGCGPGIDTLNLARLVGEKGCVVGVDQDEAMLAEADRRAAESCLNDRVTHRRADATRLPFAPEYFHACRCERVLIHLSDSLRAVSEMHRVLKPGGWLVLAEPDWGSLSISTGQVETERRLVRVRSENALSNGYAGRRLLQSMLAVKLVDIALEVFPIWSSDLAQIRHLTMAERVEEQAISEGWISPDDIAAWREDLAERSRRGTLFAHVNLVLAAGRKPASSTEVGA